MDLLLDTHALLWILEDDPRLSVAARAAFLDDRRAVWVSVGAIWELAIKLGLGKLALARSLQHIVEKELPSLGVSLLPIDPSHLLAVQTLPHHHRDPFDRLFVAQATVVGLAVVSADHNLDRYGVVRVW